MHYVPVVQAVIFASLDLCIVFLTLATQSREAIKKIFAMASVAVFVSQLTAVLDMINSYTGVSLGAPVLYLMYALMFISGTVATIGWYLYLRLHLQKPMSSYRLRRPIILTPLATIIVLCLLAPFNHALFYVDPYGIYHRGSLFVFELICPAMYILAGLVAAIYDYHVRGSESIVLRKLVLVILPSSVCIYIQMGLQIDADYTQIGASIALLLTYMSLFKDQEREREDLKGREKAQQKMLDSTLRALAYSIDAKDTYTRGHSERVAEYSLKLAKNMHLSDEQCKELVQAALLHDIGKLGVSEGIINKPDLLIDEEIESIKTHTERGDLILSQFEDVPYLRVGARYHHERYDGKGYPDGLKGEEIPLYARIIAVADAYDAMSSNRIYRNTMDQARVKQEIWKGRGTQFDPHIGRQMISLIDADVNYEMREKPGEKNFFLEEIRDSEFWNREKPMKIKAEDRVRPTSLSQSFGGLIHESTHWLNPMGLLKVAEHKSTVRFTSRTKPDSKYIWHVPTVIVYSSDDGTISDGKGYEELSVIIGAGYHWKAGSTLHTVSDFTRNEAFTDWDDWCNSNKSGLEYRCEIYREKNYVHLIFDNELITVTASVELPTGYSREIFLAVTGECCSIESIKIE